MKIHPQVGARREIPLATVCVWLPTSHHETKLIFSSSSSSSPLITYSKVGEGKKTTQSWPRLMSLSIQQLPFVAVPLGHVSFIIASGNLFAYFIQSSPLLERKCEFNMMEFRSSLLVTVYICLLMLLTSCQQTTPYSQTRLLPTEKTNITDSNRPNRRLFFPKLIERNNSLLDHHFSS